MVPLRTLTVALLFALLIAAPAFATRTHRAATSGHRRNRHHRVVQGQRQIEPERAREIQDALIREHYLTAPASGQWDANTEAAMQKYQADHGWQTKLTPDSRALIKLGLGPHDAAPAGATLSPSAASAPDDAAHTPPPGTLAAAHSLQN
jgi:peptidoglycan hydrolase-like protein with peptidoglycan-binding domain